MGEAPLQDPAESSGLDQARIGKILQGADPPDCDLDVETMLAEAGLSAPELFFSSLFWGGWIATRQPYPLAVNLKR
jgi:hypothetical protein